MYGVAIAPWMLHTEQHYNDVHQAEKPSPLEYVCCATSVCLSAVPETERASGRLDSPTGWKSSDSSRASCCNMNCVRRLSADPLSEPRIVVSFRICRIFVSVCRPAICAYKRFRSFVPRGAVSALLCTPLHACKCCGEEKSGGRSCFSIRTHTTRLRVQSISKVGAKVSYVMTPIRPKEDLRPRRSDCRAFDITRFFFFL